MQSRATPNARHDRHDRLLVTRFAMGDAYPSESEKARQLVDSCRDCAALAADIRLVAARAGQLPDARRPRDFRISAAQAEQLRGSWLERLLRSLSAPSWTVVQPLASAALVVGLSLAVIGALPLGATGGAAETVDFGATATSAGAPNAQPSQQPPAVGQLPQPTEVAGAASTGRIAEASPAPSTPGVLPEYAASVPPPAPGTTPASDTATGSQVNGKNTTAAPASPGTVVAPATPPPAPPLAAPTQNIAIVPAPPGGPLPSDLLGTAPPAPPVTSGQVPAAAAAPPSNHDVLALLGIALAAVALAVLLVAWWVRRRYSDPLIR